MAQIGDLLHIQGRVGAKRFGQGFEHLAEVGTTAQGKAGFGKLSARFVQQGQEVTTGLTGLTEKQHISALGVIVGGQEVAKPGQQSALGLGIEQLISPVGPDQGCGLIGAAQIAPSRCQSHDPSRGLRRAGLEPIHDGLVR